jgi:tetratricopeptide (TPR) repeat protein
MIKKIILVLVVLILAIGAGFYIYKDLNKSNQAAVTEPEQDKNKNSACDIVGNHDCDKAKAEILEPGKEIAIPNLDRPVENIANLERDVFQVAEKKLNGIISALKSDPSLFFYWLDLGSYRKMTGDYWGAKEAWEYIGAIRPLNSVSFNNLGDLYAYYLKDNKKAEENFLVAIKNGPDQVYIYRNLYDFYLNVLKDSTKAKAILEKGIATNPATSQDLKYLLDNL